MTEQMLRQYTVLVEYLGATLGPDYEVVLHEILPETSRVAAIANGTISGRDVGAPITNAALRMIMQKQYETSDYNLNYTGQLANGKTIRSSTMFIKDGGKLVGLLCINFDDSRFHEISDAILKLIHPDDFVHHHYFPVDAPAKQPMQPQHAAAVPAEHFQSDMNVDVRPAMPPKYMIPGTPRLRLPDFSVMISPSAPNMITVPNTMAECRRSGNFSKKSNIFSSSLLVLRAGLDLIVDEELAAEDEEQNDAGDDLRDVFVQAEVGSDLHRALVEERQQRRD